MTSRPNYQKCISLTPEENELVNMLMGRGVKFIEIFRKGLYFYCPDASGALKTKVKDLL